MYDRNIKQTWRQRLKETWSDWQHAIKDINADGKYDKKSKIKDISSAVFDLCVTLLFCWAVINVAHKISDWYNSTGAFEDLEDLQTRAGNGDPKAQHLWASKYLLGTDFAPSARMAAIWFDKSASQGYVDAQYAIGLLHLQGRGVAKDFSIARSWFLKAANQGSPGAQYKLGEIYEQGKGVEIDLVEAHKWFNLSAAAGNTAADQGLKKLSTRMTKSQIAEAHGRVRARKPVQQAH
jgi:TPR repeat protein